MVHNVDEEMSRPVLGVNSTAECFGRSPVPVACLPEVALSSCEMRQHRLDVVGSGWQEAGRNVSERTQHPHGPFFA